MSGIHRELADAAILRCVQRCAQARDWRGRWRERDSTQWWLGEIGSTPAIARATAQAAADLGAFIAESAARAQRAGA